MMIGNNFCIKSIDSESLEAYRVNVVPESRLTYDIQFIGFSTKRDFIVIYSVVYR